MALGVPSVRSLLLDTNIVLHLTRDGSTVGKSIDAQFGLSVSSFRPAICEVTVGELLSFTHSRGWGDRRVSALRTEIDRCLMLPISTPGVHARWAELRTDTRRQGLTLSDNDLWIAATAHVGQFTVLTTDTSDFGHLRQQQLVSAILIDAKTGLRLP